MSSQAFPLGPTYGAELLATFLSIALWGVTCTQTFLYFLQYPKDRSTFKVLVSWLWIADTVHQILIIKGVYTSLITDFCDYSHVTTVVPEYLWQGLVTALVAIPSQMFFIHRIWTFCGRKWIFLALLAPVAAFELAATVAFIALGTITPTPEELVSFSEAMIFTTGQAAFAVADLLISTNLVYMLWKSRGDALKGSRNVLQKLIILSVNTGSWTAVFALGDLITIIVLRTTYVYAALYFPLCPLYCNTVLANLNAREHIRAGFDSEPGNDSCSSGPMFKPQSTIKTQQTVSSSNLMTCTSRGGNDPRVLEENAHHECLPSVNIA